MIAMNQGYDNLAAKCIHSSWEESCESQTPTYAAKVREPADMKNLVVGPGAVLSVGVWISSWAMRSLAKSERLLGMLPVVVTSGRVVIPKAEIYTEAFTCYPLLPEMLEMIWTGGLIIWLPCWDICFLGSYSISSQLTFHEEINEFGWFLRNADDKVVNMLHEKKTVGKHKNRCKEKGDF